MPARDEILDVAVVGGGFAGAALAAALAARGFRIAMCDPHEVHPQDFRAEKLAPEQVDALARLGLAAAALAHATPVGDVRIAREGKIVDLRPTREFSFDYRTLVQSLRARIPDGVFVRHRVEAIDVGEGEPRIHLNGAAPLRARLVALATGLAISLRKPLGLERSLVRENHSLCIGFDLQLAPTEATAAALTYYGERIGDRIGYVTIFPIEERSRANLFAYRPPTDPWSRAFRAEPDATLSVAMPGLRRLLPRFSIPQPPVLRPVHLYGPPETIRAGVALIGDAYSTTCPAGGGGLGKALIDIERLIAHLMRWRESGRDIAAADIAEYYNDPLKRSSEARARRAAEISRASAIDPGLFWEARRKRNFYGTRVNSWLRRAIGGPSGSM